MLLIKASLAILGIAALVGVKLLLFLRSRIVELRELGPVGIVRQQKVGELFLLMGIALLYTLVLFLAIYLLSLAVISSIFAGLSWHVVVLTALLLTIAACVGWYYWGKKTGEKKEANGDVNGDVNTKENR